MSHGIVTAFGSHSYRADTEVHDGVFTCDPSVARLPRHRSLGGVGDGAGSAQARLLQRRCRPHPAEQQRRHIHHIIDPATNRVTDSSGAVRTRHNLTTHPDGLYYYCSNESQDTVDVFDTKTLSS